MIVIVTIIICNNRQAGYLLMQFV